MNEPEWVYAQRRQRAAVAGAMVVGAIVMIALFASTLASGLQIDLDGPSPKRIAAPDVDEVLAREQRVIDARNERKTERRQQREEREKEPRRPKKPKKPKGDKNRAKAPAPAATPPRSAPAPAPAPAATPNPATAPAPAAPQPQPSPASSGGLDPRFY